MLNTTYSRTITWHTNTHIAAFTPISTPRVFNDIVSYTIFIAKSNSKNCLIKFCTTSYTICNNTSKVMLESIILGINSYSNRLQSNCSFQLFFWIGRYFGKLCNFDFTKCWLIEASSCKRCVGIILFTFYQISLSIKEAIILPSTTASLSVFRAIKTLLFWKFQKLACW